MGEVIQFVPRPNPKRKSLELQAMEFVAIALSGIPAAMEAGCVIYESSLGWIPQEKDPA